MLHCLRGLGAVLMLGCSAAALAAGAPSSAEVDRFLAETIVAGATPAKVTAKCDSAIAMIGSMRAALEHGNAPATLESVWRPYDDMNAVIGFANEAYLISQSNPDKATREAAEACYQKLSDVSNSLSLSTPIYKRLAAIPLGGADPGTVHVIQRVLLSYRIAGVDRDEATRGKIDALNKQITATGLKFDGNIRDLKAETLLAPGDLAGMPQDYIDAHKPGADGKIHISTDYPDTIPIFDFAAKESTRRAVYMTFINRAWPQNGAVLKELLSERAELARLVGKPNYAALVLADRMVDSPAKVQDFLVKVNDAALPGALADDAELLARWQRIEPAATQVAAWNRSYTRNLLQKEKYEVDDAEVRRYFTLAKAQAGIFGLVHDLFGADIRPWNKPVWDKSVSAWELHDGTRLIGRFYLDLSPREGKYNHAAQFSVRVGTKERTVPIATLVTNFPATGPMDHRDVETFLHEFGHLIHALYSGAVQPTYLAGMDRIELDFIEAPSQLLEEWVWDYDTLKRFASDPDGKPIPADLVARMNKARHFGEGLMAKGQISYSAVALDYYSKPPATLDLDRDWQEQQERFSLTPYVPGSHGWASFNHLNGYSAAYYTYVWSKAIALDLFTRFEKNGLRDPATAMAYRRLVLEPGGSKPAGQLVTDFLGRPLSLDAYRRRLASGEEQ